MSKTEIKKECNHWLGWRAPDFYKPLESHPHTINPQEWNECPCCNEKPRVWIFDNGAYAKCKCQDTYAESAAEGLSIWDYHKAHNGDMSLWNHNDLRDNWNRYVGDKCIISN